MKTLALIKRNPKGRYQSKIIGQPEDKAVTSTFTQKAVGGFQVILILECFHGSPTAPCPLHRCFSYRIFLHVPYEPYRGLK